MIIVSFIGFHYNKVVFFIQYYMRCYIKDFINNYNYYYSYIDRFPYFPCQNIEQAVSVGFTILLLFKCE
jgi:hypothetical protein